MCALMKINIKWNAGVWEKFVAFISNLSSNLRQQNDSKRLLSECERIEFVRQRNISYFEA
jgi:hypothetical protein